MDFVLACLLLAVKKFWPGGGKEAEKNSLLNPTKLFVMKIVYKPLSWCIIFLIRGYRLLLSPLLGSHCRFHPTCSEYGLYAFQRFPFFKAFWLAVRRILKCHPFSKGGADPLSR